MRINKDKIYKSDEFIHFVRIHDGSNREILGKLGVTSVHSNYDTVEIPFNDFIKINMNTKGESVPYSNRNVINISRYMFWYWMPIIGSDPICLYILLTEYCNDETDICFPKIKDLAQRLDRSLPTVRKCLAILEENNFIIVINRLNKLKSRRETSPIFKVRQTTPLISSEQYNELPAKLKEKHDEFIANNMSIEVPEQKHNHKDTVKALIDSGEVLITKRRQERILASLETERATDKVYQTLSDKQIAFNEKIHEILQSDDSEITKPSYDSLFLDSIFIQEEYSKFIIVSSIGTSEILKTHTTYTDILIRIMKQLSSKTNCEVVFVSHERYHEM